MTKPLLEARQEVSRQEIIAIATEQFAHKGVRATSLSQLASALGITKAALYYYFDSKHEIVIETVRANIAAFTDAVLGELPEGLDPEQAMRASVDAKLAQIENEGPQPLRFFYTVMLEELDEPEVEDVFREFWQMGRDAARSLIEAGQADGTFHPDVEVDTVLDVLTATFLGIDLLWLNDPERVDPRAAYRVAIDQIIATLKQPPAS